MANFYYADHDRRTIGPISIDDLRQLKTKGTISDSTLIIEEGGASWRKFGEYSPPQASTSGSGYSPPPVPRPADAAHDRIAAGVANASAKADAGATLVKDSAVATFQAARTYGEKGVLFGAIGAIFAFFLPWAGAFGGSISGFGVAQQASALLFLLPVSMAFTCFLSYLNIKARRRDRILRARWFTVIGTFWCAIAVLATVAGRSFFGVAAIGLYVTLLATAAVAAGGVLQIGEQVSSLPD